MLDDKLIHSSNSFHCEVIKEIHYITSICYIYDLSYTALAGRRQEIASSASRLRSPYFLLRSEILRGRPMQAPRRDYQVRKECMTHPLYTPLRSRQTLLALAQNNRGHPLFVIYLMRIVQLQLLRN